MSAGADDRHGGLTRRSFLLTLGVGTAAAAVFVATQHWPAPAQSKSRRWSDWLLDGHNRQAVARLGNAYLAAHAAQRDAGVLIDAIDRALATTAAAPAAPVDNVALLQQRVRHEYTRGEVARVSGWVLSVTEARLYALVALESAPEEGAS
jgi:hypothetical protein